MSVLLRGEADTAEPDLIGNGILQPQAQAFLNFPTRRSAALTLRLQITLSSSRNAMHEQQDEPHEALTFMSRILHTLHNPQISKKQDDLRNRSSR